MNSECFLRSRIFHSCYMLTVSFTRMHDMTVYVIKRSTEISHNFKHKTPCTCCYDSLKKNEQL